ncbi:MAG: prolyl oligopeptidase family serine peptidase [Rubrivivax sp.]|jgi:dipeptidyl aminopeptidase/acylaminoacyl peptidase
MADKNRTRPITLDDLWSLERLGAPSLSPDGAQAVATLTRYSMEDNKASSSLWLYSTLGGQPRLLTTCGDKDGAPQWSPAPGHAAPPLIAFTARRDQQGAKDKQAQIYLIAPDGGEAWRAANVATGVEAFRWHPAGDRIVFVSWVWPDLKGDKAQAKAQKAFDERKETAYVTSEATYRHWDHHLPMGRVPHLHLLTLGAAGEAGTVRDLFEGTAWELERREPGVHSFDVSPDGKRLVFAFDPAAEKRPDGRFALAEMDLKTRRVDVIAQDADWDFSAPRYSPDGRKIAFVASHQGLKHTMPAQLAVIERSGKAWTKWDVVSAEWDHAVHAPLQWEADGSAVLFMAEDKARTHLWRFELADRRAEVVVSGGWVSGFDKAAGTLVTLADSAMHPARLHAHLPGQAARRIESVNDALMSKLALGRVEERWIQGAQGDKVQMWLVHPPQFDTAKASKGKQRWPILHSIHGGPHTCPGDNWHYRWNTQLFAAQGYVVANVNYHGSSGFGHAFLDSITHRWGELELQDVEAGTDALLKEPWADKSRVFASGGSYGGYMAMWMNGHLPAGRYRAYVCHAGCWDWIGMFADDAWAWHAKELGAWYWNDMARVHRQSPHAHAAGLSTPTLVIHGALDYRVPDAQGLAYYNTLKAQGVPARLVWFPDENHWILKPRNSKLWHQEFFDWLAHHDPARNGNGAKARPSRRG